MYSRIITHIIHLHAIPRIMTKNKIVNPTGQTYKLETVSLESKISNVTLYV